MEHLGSPGPRPGWSIQTTGVLSKGHTKGSSGRWWGVSCSQVLLGSHYQELVFACDSAGGYLGHAVRGGEGGPSVSPRPLQASWPHKMYAEAPITRSSLAKLLTGIIYKQ